MTKLSIAVLSQEDRDLLSELKGVVSRHVPDADILLYGSVARGTATTESDYDLLVIASRKLSRSEEDSLDADVYQLQLEQEVVFSVSVVASDEWEQPIMMNCYTSWNFTQATCSAVMNTNQ